MESNAKVVIVGGGVVGCSILYHLSKFGLKDCILLERNEFCLLYTSDAADE